MSNGEVNRWQSWVIADEVQRFQPVPEFFVSDEDHERVVAELTAQLEHSETKVGWLLRDNEKNVRELKAEAERQRDAYEAALENHVSMQLEIAKQAKVIEVLKKEVEMAEERNSEIEAAARESNMINIKQNSLIKLLQASECQPFDAYYKTCEVHYGLLQEDFKKQAKVIEKLREQLVEATGIDWDMTDGARMLAYYDDVIAEIERGEA